MPVRRMKRRYLALRIEGARPSDEAALRRLILEALVRLFGEDGVVKTRPKIIEYRPSEGIGIVGCSHKHMGLLRAALASVVEVDGEPIALHVVDVSGTLRTLRKRLSSRAR